jgi:hypothetical protein
MTTNKTENWETIDVRIGHPLTAIYALTSKSQVSSTFPRFLEKFHLEALLNMILCEIRAACETMDG